MSDTVCACGHPKSLHEENAEDYLAWGKPSPRFCRCTATEPMWTGQVKHEYPCRCDGFEEPPE